MEKPAQQVQWQNGEQASSWSSDCCVFTFPCISCKLPACNDSVASSAQGKQLNASTIKAVMKATKRMLQNKAFVEKMGIKWPLKYEPSDKKGKSIYKHSLSQHERLNVVDLKCSKNN